MDIIIADLKKDVATLYADLLVLDRLYKDEKLFSKEPEIDTIVNEIKDMFNKHNIDAKISVFESKEEVKKDE